MFYRYCQHRWHRHVELCWYSIVITLFTNVDQYRNNIVSILYASNLVYIVPIIDIAMLYDFESTLYRYCLTLITLFTSFTSPTSQCCTISNQHRVDIHYITLFFLHLRHCNHAIRSRMNIVSTWFTLKFPIYFLDIAKLLVWNCEHIFITHLK